MSYRPMAWMALTLSAIALPCTAIAACDPADFTDPVRSIEQGGMVTGRAPSGSTVTVQGQPVVVSSTGRYVFGVARDASGSIAIRVKSTCGETGYSVAVKPRNFPVERINGVPPGTANPRGAIAERIKREQALVTQARERNDDRQGYLERFIWPVKGRISGRFGSYRSYNGTPGAGHSGMDIAVPTGTPIKAPASGIVSFASPSLYLTGGTVVLDHGQGISSNFLHMSRLDVKVGDVIRQGQVIGAVGATGRATGPHLHWGMNWLTTRIDPLLLLPSP